MSAIAVALGTDGIIIASDGVCYTYETGHVSGFVSKIILLPEYDCFIGSTGAGAFMTALRWELEQQVTCFDDLVEAFGDLCEIVHRKLFTNIFGRWEDGPLTEVSCVIGGWSDARQAYEAYRVVSYDKPSVDLSDGRSIRLEPFKPTPLPGALWCSYMPDTMEEFGLAPPLQNEETINVAARLICACRADSGFVVDKDGQGDDRFHMVGGFLQLTVLQRGHVQSWIAHRWQEDQIGQPIEATGPGRFPEWLKERYEAARAAESPVNE